MSAVDHPAFDEFVATVAALCHPETGCPWNRTQTHETLGDYLIEESYETLDAIEEGNPRHLQEELGDVLLQVVLHSQIAANAGEFTIDDVCASINEKMIRRHPHVFAGVKAETANEVNDLWESVKLSEQEAKKTSNGGVTPGLLEDVPKHFPALLQAQKISRKAAAAGFEWESVADVWTKVDEERAELEEAYAAAPKSPDGRMTVDEAMGSPKADERSRKLVDEASMEFGDLLFALVNVGRKMGIDAEAALRASNEKFRRRFAFMESAAANDGQCWKDLTLDSMEAYWNQAKEQENHG